MMRKMIKNVLIKNYDEIIMHAEPFFVNFFWDGLFNNGPTHATDVKIFNPTTKFGGDDENFDPTS